MNQSKRSFSHSPGAAFVGYLYFDARKRNERMQFRLKVKQIHESVTKAQVSLFVADMLVVLMRHRLSLSLHFDVSKHSRDSKNYDLKGFGEGKKHNLIYGLSYFFPKRKLISKSQIEENYCNCLLQLRFGI